MEEIKVNDSDLEKVSLWGRCFIDKEKAVPFLSKDLTKRLTNISDCDQVIFNRMDKLDNDFKKTIIEIFREAEVDVNDLFVHFPLSDAECDYDRLAEKCKYCVDITEKDMTSLTLTAMVEDNELQGFDCDFEFDYDLRDAVKKYNIPDREIECER